MIEQIEELCAELNLKLFSDIGVLENGEIEIHQSRTDQGIAPVVANDGPVRSNRERREASIIQVHHSLAPEIRNVGIAAGHTIGKGPWIGAVLPKIICRRDHSERSSRARSHNQSNLPSFTYPAESRIRLGSRDSVETVYGEVPANVEVAWTTPLLLIEKDERWD